MKKILIVDDDVRLMSMLRRMLEATQEYEVMTEDSGQRALAATATFKPELIILDMNMPGMGGVEFLKGISAHDGTLRYPVLVMTSRANMATFFDDVAVEGFLAKPCDPEELRKEIDRILSKTATVQRTILLGEDDYVVREGIVNAFIKAGYNVEYVSQGPQILELAIVKRPDLIMVKRILTKLNGNAVVRLLKEIPSTCSIPVVLYDGRQDAENEALFEQSMPGVNKYVDSDNPLLLLAAAKEVLANFTEQDRRTQ